MSKRILLFARDPGGAQAVACLVPALAHEGYSLTASALELGLSILGARVDSLEAFPAEELDKVTSFVEDWRPHLVLTGTSGEGKAEKLLWRAAEILGIPCLAVLDSWVNYGIRFSSRSLSQWSAYRQQPDLQFLPTFIAVMDDLAYREMIAEGIPGERILVTGQPYFDALTAKALHPPVQTSRKTLLFASEPLEKSYGSSTPLGYTEKSILKEILQALQEFERELLQDVELLIQLHPREDPGSYDQVIHEAQAHPIQIRKSPAVHPHSLVTRAHAVLGMGSNLLVEAALLGARVAVIQIGLRTANPSVLCRGGYLVSWDTREKLRTGLRELLQSPDPRSRAATFPVEPAIPKILRIVRQLCQNPKQSPRT